VLDLGITLIPQGHVDTAAKPEKDISVVIAHRGEELGLWATIHSCEADLKDSGLTYEFIIVANGEEELSHDLKRVKHYAGFSGHLGDFVHVAEPLSPPTARQIGTESATGRFLCFFDNHCLVQHGYFRRAVDMMEKHGIDSLHSTTLFFAGETPYYEYRLKLSSDFWAHQPYTEPLHATEPYRIAMAGHGGFIVRRSVWQEVGGYWQGFEGYGGEESYFDLKLWLLGKENWIDPQLIHYHWSGVRKYQRHFSDDFFRNMLMCANIIGGEDWANKVFKSFLKYTRLKPTTGENKPMFDLLLEAQEKSAAHAQWMAQHRTRSLDELLAHFAQNNIRT
jgi:hypothetical protein